MVLLPILRLFAPLIKLLLVGSVVLVGLELVGVPALSWTAELLWMTAVEIWHWIRGQAIDHLKPW